MRVSLASELGDEKLRIVAGPSEPLTEAPCVNTLSVLARTHAPLASLLAHTASLPARGAKIPKYPVHWHRRELFVLSVYTPKEMGELAQRP